MDRKSRRGSNARASRPKKRRFKGNQFTCEKDVTFTSESAAKQKKTGDEDVIIAGGFGYCILEFFSVFTTLSSLVLCAKCKEKIKFSQTAPRGLGFKIALQCNCENIQYIQSSPLINNAFEINRRTVMAMRLLGIGRQGINIFCSIMDMCSGLSISTYYGCLDNLYTAANTIYDQIISKAAKEEQELISQSEPDANPTHLTVAEGGTWKKRGFASLFGVTTLVGELSKKVVDTIVKSSFCQDCDEWKQKKKSDIEAYNEWYEEHKDLCTVNCQESAEKMEVDAVAEMFKRSIEKHGVKFVKYVGNGDTKIFKGILDMDPYNSDPVVEQKDCVGHVNNNEILNSLIWTFAPKHIHAGVRTIEIANYLAVTIVNEGFLQILKIMSIMGITIGNEAHSFAVRRDELRIDRSELRASAASEEASTSHLAGRTAENITFEVEEGPMYGAWIAD